MKMWLEYQRIKFQLKNGLKFSHLLTVRADVADPPPLTVSLTVICPVFWRLALAHCELPWQINVQASKLSLETCQIPFFASHVFFRVDISYWIFNYGYRILDSEFLTWILDIGNLPNLHLCTTKSCLFQSGYSCRQVSLFRIFVE